MLPSEEEIAQAEKDVDAFMESGTPLPPRPSVGVSAENTLLFSKDADALQDMHNGREGTYYNIPLAAYLSAKIWSQSSLKEARKSAAHAYAARSSETRKPPTDAMILGSALHVAFLEPEEVSERVVTWTGNARRGEAWADFQAKHKGKIILTQGMADQLWGMMNALRKSEYIQRVSKTISDIEITEVGDVCGLKMKGRVDALAGNIVYDFKKVANADPRKFLHDVIAYGYDSQGAVYCELFECERFILIAVEEDPPHDIVPFELSPDMLANGRRKMKGYIQTVRRAEETGVWSGRAPTGPIVLDSPEWDAQPEVDTEDTIQRDFNE